MQPGCAHSQNMLYYLYGMCNIEYQLQSGYSVSILQGKIKLKLTLTLTRQCSVLYIPEIAYSLESLSTIHIVHKCTYNNINENETSVTETSWVIGAYFSSLLAWNSLSTTQDIIHIQNILPWQPKQCRSKWHTQKKAIRNWTMVDIWFRPQWGGASQSTWLRLELYALTCML